MVECNRRGNNRETDNQTTVTDLITGYSHTCSHTKQAKGHRSHPQNAPVVQTALVNKQRCMQRKPHVIYCTCGSTVLTSSVLIGSTTATSVQLNVNFIWKQLLLCRITVEQNGIKTDFVLWSMRCVYKVITVQISQKRLLTRIIERVIST